MEHRKLESRLKLFYIVYFASLAAFLPFLAVYLQGKGLDFGRIGIILAVFSITGVAIQPMWGYVSDKLLGKRRTLMVLLLGATAAALGFNGAYTFASILAVMLIFVFFQSPAAMVLDSLVYELAEDNPGMQYGRFRLMGSFGFAVGALAMGQFVTSAGVSRIFWVFGALSLVGVLILSGIRSDKRDSHAPLRIEDVGRVLGDRRVIFFLIAAGILNISIGSNNSYLPVLILSTGGSLSHVGLMSFLIAMVELPFFFNGDRLILRYGPLRMLMVSGVIYAGRFFIVSTLDSFIPVMAVQLVQGISFAFYMVSSMHYLNSVVPANMKATAMTVFGAVTVFGNFLGNMFGGQIIESTGVFVLFKVLAAVSLLSCAVVAYLARISRNMEDLPEQIK